MGTITLNLPIVGQPDSTEEPKIPTALTQLQTLLNGNIDRSNLAVGAGGLTITGQNANYAAVSGDLVLIGQGAAGSYTVTAPMPTVNATFGVVVGGYLSGVQPVTIQHHGSEFLFGEGFAGGVPSLTMGTPMSMIVFESDGISWVQSGGERNTGWVPLSLHSVTSSGGYGANVRVVGDRGELCGALTVAGSGVTDFAALPSSVFAPAAGVAWDKPYQGTGGVMVMGRLTLNGLALALTGGAPVVAGAVFSLNGLTYPLS